jgi:hypothetical protein
MYNKTDNKTYMKEIVYLILGMLAIAQIQIIILANTIIRIHNEKK